MNAFKWIDMVKYYAVCLLILTDISGCKQTAVVIEEPEKVRVAQVDVITVEPVEWVETLRTFGEIEAAEEITITTDISGQVTRVLFKEGDRVTAGQPLIELDTEKTALRLTQARTMMEESRAALDVTRSNMDRHRILYSQGNISKMAFEKMELEMKAATARYEDALAAVHLAERELADCRIDSPAGGVVDQRSINPGEAVMPGAPLAVIQVSGGIRVATFVSEKDVNHLRLGSEARVSTRAVSSDTFLARIESVGAKAHNRTGNFPVKLAIETADSRLRPGMTAEVELQGRRYSRALLIPENSMVDRHRRRVVYKVMAGRAVEVEPLVSLTAMDTIHVLSGLAAGDRLIVSGIEHITHGSPVAIREAHLPREADAR